LKFIHVLLEEEGLNGKFAASLMGFPLIFNNETQVIERHNHSTFTHLYEDDIKKMAAELSYPGHILQRPVTVHNPYNFSVKATKDATL
jgi:hypothetical protein